MHSLEKIVKTHFPMIEDRFNFKMQKLKYISIAYNHSTTTTSVFIDHSNIYGYEPKAYTWCKVDDGINILKKIINDIMYPGVKHNQNYNSLLEQLLISYTKMLEKAYKSKNKKLDKMCEFEYARYNENICTTYYEYRKLISKSTHSKILGIITMKDKIYFKKFGPEVKNASGILITIKNKYDIYKYYCETLILNKKQKQVVLDSIDEAIIYNNM